ncbi:hypothetical protein TNCV_37951 [Trichonephila clavipes]|nr:hypothetical protein TNCV_37951 [Trichonephila clavipes]
MVREETDHFATSCICCDMVSDVAKPVLQRGAIRGTDQSFPFASIKCEVVYDCYLFMSNQIIDFLEE